MSGRGTSRRMFVVVATGAALIAVGAAVVVLAYAVAGWTLIFVGALALFVGPMAVAAAGSGALRRQDNDVRGRTFVTDLFSVREPERKGGQRDLGEADRRW